MAFDSPAATRFYDRALDLDSKTDEGLHGQFRIKWSPYIPHNPTDKQLAFLWLTNREAFYGGSAGGGKSDAILMAALQYVDVPGYSAIIFRKQLTDANQPGAVLSRLHEWLHPYTDVPLDQGGVKWDGSKTSYFFPSGARIQFGYMSDELAYLRYMSAEFQYIAFDEVTQFFEEEYRWMFSRLRKTQCPNHEGRQIRSDPMDANSPYIESPLPYDPQCKSCVEYAPLARVPLRMRAASNPGGPGHLWIKKRYRIQQIDGIYRGTHPKRAYIPAFAKDNPYLDPSYAQSLKNLDPVTRDQLMKGDWGISANGRFRKSWVRYYSVNGDYVILGADCKGPSFHKSECRKIQIVDPAASQREGPGDQDIWRRAASWSVIGTYYITPRWDLLVHHVWRKQVEIPELCQAIIREYQEQNPEYVGIEANGLNIGVYQFASRSGINTRPLMPRSMDKLVRATSACNRMEQGKIYFPDENNHPTANLWLDDWESEIFTWVGHPKEPSDQVDDLAYAAMQVDREAAGDIGYGMSEEDLPSIIY